MAAAIPVLLVSTATRSYGAARTPRALAKAGFEVTLLTPRNALAEASRFVARVAYLPDGATPLEWIHAVAATVRAISPRQVMPCDDVSFRLLAMLALSPPPQMQPALQAELAGLVRASLGNSDYYEASVDATLLDAAAAQAGVRVPGHAVIGSLEEAHAYAERVGFPVVVKQPHALTSDSARLVADARALTTAIAELAAPQRDGFEADATRRLVLQRYIDGSICYQDVAAWQGRYLAGYAGQRVEPQGEIPAAGTVVRVHDSPALRDFSAQLVEAFGMTGLFTGEYIVEKSTGLPYLVEIKRRIGPCTHFGGVINVDLCAALHAAMQGAASPTRSRPDPGEERIFVQFPGEWLRDPHSPWLRRHPVDVPWDDPELLDAMLALRAD